MFKGKLQLEKPQLFEQCPCACVSVCVCVRYIFYVQRQTLLYLDVMLQYVGQGSGKNYLQTTLDNSELLLHLLEEVFE